MMLAGSRELNDEITRSNGARRWLNLLVVVRIDQPEFGFTYSVRANDFAQKHKIKIACKGQPFRRSQHPHEDP